MAGICKINIHLSKELYRNHLKDYKSGIFNWKQYEKIRMLDKYPRLRLPTGYSYSTHVQFGKARSLGNLKANYKDHLYEEGAKDIKSYR